MQKKILLLIVVLITIVNLPANAQYQKLDTSYKSWFVGTTPFMLFNFVPKNSPDFVQLNLGYRITGTDVISLELKSWKYAWPLGIPYGDSFEAPEEEFPGFVREGGFAIVYQKYFWKGLYAGVHVMSAWQRFVDMEGMKIDNGFQLFNTYRLGYHFKLIKDRFFIQPSIAVTHRPYHTEMPEAFKEIDARWPNFFLGEPGLHIGYNF